MARQIIDVGTLALNGQDGDTNRDAAVKSNANFEELYGQQENFVRGAGIVQGGSVAVFDGTTGKQLASKPLADFEPALPGSGNASQYINGLKQLASFAASVRDSILTGLDLASAAAVVATDSVLVAIGKLQAQVTGKAAKGANSDITQLSGLTTALSVEQGGTGVKALPVIFTRLRDSQPLTYAEAASERVRMKIFEPVNFVTDMDDVSNAQIRGPGYVTTSTTGTKPGGSPYGVLTTTIVSTDVVNQEFVPLSGAAGVTFPAYRRTGYGVTAGRWGPWRMVMDSGSALLDPDAGGLMSSTVVNGFTVLKFANGAMCMMGKLPDVAQVPANGSVNITATIPSGFLSVDYMFPVVICTGNVSIDHYGVGNYYIASPTSFNFGIKNGASAQAFLVRAVIWGRWK